MHQGVIRISFFLVFQGVFEGVFRGVSCFICWGYFCISLAFLFCSWSRGCQPKGPGEQGATGYCPTILLLKRAKMVLCPFHRSHREICTRNRPVSEMKFLDDFWGPLSLPAPLFYCYNFRGLAKGWFPKGWFWWTFPRNENGNEGTFGTKTGTRVRTHVRPERQTGTRLHSLNHPFTKPPFCLLSKFKKKCRSPGQEKCWETCQHKFSWSSRQNDIYKGANREALFGTFPTTPFGTGTSEALLLALVLPGSLALL